MRKLLPVGAVVACGVIVGVAAVMAASSTTDRIVWDSEEVAKASAACANVWDETRDALVRSGAPDGESRRQADLARQECEVPLTGSVEETPVDGLPCAAEVERRDAIDRGEASHVGAYFSCMASIGGKDPPVYRFDRPVEGNAQALANPSGRIETALLAYLDGPTSEEKKLGYMTAMPTPFAEALDHVTVEGATASVSFTAVFEERLGSIPNAAAEALVLELKSTVLQFEDVDAVTLSVAGDCHRFWGLLQRTCSTLKREES